MNGKVRKLGVDTSELISQKTQADGSILVHEHHTDSSGKVHVIIYFAGAGADLAALRAARAAFIEQKLIAHEVEALVFELPWDAPFVHATANDLVAFVRSEYKESVTERTARIARRILEWITEGRFTDLQVRNAFGLTAGQWTTLKTKMENLVTNYNAVLAAMGE